LLEELRLCFIIESCENDDSRAKTFIVDLPKKQLTSGAKRSLFTFEKPADFQPKASVLMYLFMSQKLQKSFFSLPLIGSFS
jgi:hypothetical protein